jgi:hypothetical protein
MSKLDEKLRASIKATRGKPAIPTKAVPPRAAPTSAALAEAAAAKPAAKPAANPDSPAKTARNQEPASSGSTVIPDSASRLFPERIWPD